MANTEVLKEFIGKVKQLESEREELKEYLVEQKSYDEDDAEQFIKDLERAYGNNKI